MCMSSLSIHLFFNLCIILLVIHLVCCLQVSPLTEMEKILDCEMKDAPREDTSSSEPEPKKIRHYLIKWKGLSHIHCSW
jgi:hypothetical protein